MAGERILIVEDERAVARGLEYVRETLSRNYVRADESEKIKAITRQRGRHRIIDKVKARLDTKTDRFWAEMVNMGVRDAVIADEVVHQYDKLLMGGIWSLVDPKHQTQDFKIKPSRKNEYNPAIKEKDSLPQ